MPHSLDSLREEYWKSITQLRIFYARQLPIWRRYWNTVPLRIKRKPTAGADLSHKLILLTWEFPPQVTGGVYRPLSFARYAAASGWQAEVVCGPAPDPPSQAGRYLAGLLSAEVPVTRVAADTGPHPWPLPKIDGGITNALSLFEAAAARIKPGEGGVILASGPPFSNFIAGLWLARLTGWKLALDYRDEWTQTPFRFVEKGGANPVWEKRCLARADMVIFTTPSQLAHAQGLFPELSRTVNTVVYNGWEPDDFAQATPMGRPDASAPITLAYLGNLGAMAAPNAFLNTLTAVLTTQPELRSRVRIRLVGHKRPDALEVLAAFPFPEVLELLEPIPKQEACRMMHTVDGLLLLNPAELKRYIQGKLYEYIASGTPILVFGSGGEMGEIVGSLGTGITVSEGDARALAAALLGLRAMRDGPQGHLQSWLANRERSVLAAGLYRELDTLVGAPARNG